MAVVLGRMDADASAAVLVVSCRHATLFRTTAPSVPAEPCLTVALEPEVSVMPRAVAVLRCEGVPERSGLCRTHFLLLWGASGKEGMEGALGWEAGVRDQRSPFPLCV